jgi:hypothetical protein
MISAITIKDVQVITNYNGSRMHLFSVPGSISKERAMELQAEAGYPACAYGFYGYDPTISQTIWKCANSSD